MCYIYCTYTSRVVLVIVARLWGGFAHVLRALPQYESYSSRSFSADLSARTAPTAGVRASTAAGTPLLHRPPQRPRHRHAVALHHVFRVHGRSDSIAAGETSARFEARLHHLRSEDRCLQNGR